MDCEVAGQKHKNEFKKKKEDGNISLPPEYLPVRPRWLIAAVKFIIKCKLNVRY